MLSLEQRILNLKNHFFKMNDTIYFVEDIKLEKGLAYLFLIDTDLKKTKDAIFSDSHFNIQYYESKLLG